MVRAYPTIPSPTPFDPHPRSTPTAHGLKWMQLTGPFWRENLGTCTDPLVPAKLLDTADAGESRKGPVDPPPDPTTSLGVPVDPKPGPEYCLHLLPVVQKPPACRSAARPRPRPSPLARGSESGPPVNLGHLSQRTLPPCPLPRVGPDSKAPAVELVDPKPRHLIRHYPLRSRKRFPSAYPRRFPCPGPLVTVRLLPDGSGLWTGRSSAVGPRERRRPRSLRTDHRAHYSLSAEPCPWPAEFTELHCTARHRQHPCRAA